MASGDPYRGRLRAITTVIIVVAVVGAVLIAFSFAPGVNFFAPYQSYSTSSTISPPASVYEINLGANNSNIQVYQGSNNSVFIDLTASGWVKLTPQTVYIRSNVQGNVVDIFIHTPAFLSSYTSTVKLYLPSSSVASYLSLETSNGNANVYGALNAVNITATTSNGNIGTSGLERGTLTMTTVNGNINLASTSLNNCSASTVNGNIQMTISEPVGNGTFDLTSVNGNQAVSISRLSNATLTLSTVNGNIHISNLQIDTQVSTSRDLVGTVNGGGAHLSMQTSNGNIQVSGT